MVIRKKLMKADLLFSILHLFYRVNTVSDAMFRKLPYVHFLQRLNAV